MIFAGLSPAFSFPCYGKILADIDPETARFYKALGDTKLTGELDSAVGDIYTQYLDIPESIVPRSEFKGLETAYRNYEANATVRNAAAFLDEAGKVYSKAGDSGYRIDNPYSRVNTAMEADFAARQGADGAVLPTNSQDSITIKPVDEQVGSGYNGGTNSKGATEIIHRDGSVEIIGEGDIIEVIDKRPYLNPKNRPSYRKGLVELVWNLAKKLGNGVVRDPHTQDIIAWEPGQNRQGVWDMGHIKEAKYSEMHQRYLDGEMTPEEFRDWFNDPENYTPELPKNNRGHRFE